MQGFRAEKRRFQLSSEERVQENHYARYKNLLLSCIGRSLLCSTALLAQNSAVVPRITADVDESSLTTLRGNVPRLARAEFDQGEADPSTQLTHIRLVLSRSAEQQAALDSYLAQLQDKSSPNYHKWLTPEQFGQLYGPADSDIAALVAWLESYGFQVEPVSTGRTNIAFTARSARWRRPFTPPSIPFWSTGARLANSNSTQTLRTRRFPRRLPRWSRALRT